MTLRVVAEHATVALDLWLWPLDAAPERRAALAAHLDAPERARAAACPRAADRAAFEVARGRMREILGGSLGCAPRDVPLVPGPHGRPVLGAAAGGRGPAFNLSRAGGWAALVTGPHGLALGIDIEPVAPVAPDLPERFFSPAEREELAALPPDRRQAGIFNGWTRKEALLKALGSGPTRPLDSFDVTLAPGAPARLLRLSGALAARWTLQPLDLRPDFPGCIALRHSGPVAVTVREGALPLPLPPSG